jgi:hypothetical protein
MYVFCIYLRTNNDLCHLHHKLVGFYNREENCLQRGTDWCFKYSSLRFVFKELTYNNKFVGMCSVRRVCKNLPLAPSHLSIRPSKTMFYRIQFVPRSKHSSPRFHNINLLMLYKAEDAVLRSVYSTQAQRECHVEFLNVKVASSWSNWEVKMHSAWWIINTSCFILNYNYVIISCPRTMHCDCVT